MGKFFNQDDFVEKEQIDIKKDISYVSDPETNTLVPADELNDDIKPILPKVKPSFNFQLPKINFKPKIKFNKKFLLVIPALLIIIIGIFIIKSFNKKVDVLKTDAFFLNKGDHYALFNEKGKRLTDFEFTNVGTFINNAALVQNTNSEYGVINNKGHMVVKYGKYPYVINEGPLYYLTDYDKDYYLINAKGKKIYKDVGFEIVSFGNNYVLVKHKDKYKVLNYKGKTIYKFKDEHNDSVPSISHKDDILVIYYNNVVYVINLAKNKIITKFNSKVPFCITDISNNNNVIVNACDNAGDILTPYNFKVIKNKKIIFDYVSEDNNTLKFEDDYIVKVVGDKNILLDKDGHELTNLNNNGFISDKNYLKANNNGYLGIYYKNKLKVITECKESVSTHTDSLYVLKNCTSGLFKIYNKKGKELGSYSEVASFDDGISFIKDKNKYYLINEKIKKITSGYDNIRRSEVDDYYIATDGDKEYLLNRKGKVITSGYKIKAIKEETNLGYIAVVDNLNAYVIYNVTKNKEIGTLVDEPVIEKHYYKVTKGSETNYYSYYTGEKFYTN